MSIGQLQGSITETVETASSRAHGRKLQVLRLCNWHSDSVPVTTLFRWCASRSEQLLFLVPVGRWNRGRPPAHRQLAIHTAPIRPRMSFEHLNAHFTQLSFLKAYTDLSS